MNQPIPNEVQDTLQKAQTLTAEMLASTQPDSVFSPPQEINGQTIFTASEVTAALGIGQAWRTSGGGGTSGGRPIAVITIQEDAIHIKPILDFTKISLAILTLIGSYLTLRWKMRVQ